MSKPHKHRARRVSRKINVDLAELERIVDATPIRTLTPGEHKKLQDAHQILASLATPPFRNDESAASILKGLDEEQRDPATPKPPRKGHGRKKRDAFQNAPIVAVRHDDLKSGQVCSCGCGKLYPLKRPVYFRHFVGQAPLQVTIYEREQLRCNGCSEVFTAPLPTGVGPEPYEASAVSTIAIFKYGLGLPLYRQEILYDSLGTPVAASTQWEVIAGGSRKIQPAFDELVKLAAQGKVGYFDDTSMKMLEVERKKGDERTGIHTTGIVSDNGEYKIALLFTGCEHAGENRAKLLNKRNPDLPAMIQMSDALASNFSEIETGQQLIACCLAHGRRNFIKIIDSFPEDCRHVILTMGTAYYHDKLSRERGDNDEERLAFHQAETKPVMDSLKTWLDERMDEKKVEANSTLGKAIEYLRKHWEHLTLFLRVAAAPLDNNYAERALKKVVLHRKNSLFYRNAVGAKVGDIYMSLIQTCQLNDVNPFDT
jgi:transposase